MKFCKILKIYFHLHASKNTFIVKTKRNSFKKVVIKHFQSEVHSVLKILQYRFLRIIKCLL